MNMIGRLKSRKICLPQALVAKNYCRLSRFIVTQTLTTTDRVVTAKRSISGSHASDNESSYIPKPTWSVKSLELNANHTKLPHEELHRLAHLALLDLDRLPADLEQDLANMMHMVEQVSEFVASNPDLFDEKAVDETGAFIYDSVRGVHAAPLRSSHDSPIEDDSNETIAVWQQFLKPNSIRQGGAHDYFSISTKHDDHRED